MKIAVFNVAAASGGALSILKQLHAAAGTRPEHEWIFFTSLPELSSSCNITVRRSPWIKRSWAHRLWFDCVSTPRYLRESKPDIVVSLENVPVQGTRARQVVYLQQALPFVKFQFSLIREPKMWIYEKVTRRRILGGLKKDADIVVQAEWMNQAVGRFRRNSSGTTVTIRPTMPGSHLETDDHPPPATPHFFYPASALPYKNHQLIIQALQLLEGTDISTFRVTLTVTEEELRMLGIPAVPPNVDLVGSLPQNVVMRLYRQTILLFPSLVETVGLPLIEAQREQAFILAAELPYAREALAGYPIARFFDPGSDSELATLIREIVSTYPQKIAGERISDWVPDAGYSDPWQEFINFIVRGSAK